MTRKSNPRAADRLMPGDTVLEDVGAQVRLWSRGLGFVKRVDGVIVATIPAVLMESHGPQIEASCVAVTNVHITFKEVDP